MKVAIMQPYFFPYIGYFQLINAVDKFVFYDDVNFIKRGWINRNRILINSKDSLIIVPLKKVSQNKAINETYLDLDIKQRKRLVSSVQIAYKKAPYFDSVYYLIENIINFKTKKISDYAANSIKKISEYLGLSTGFYFSSIISLDTKGIDKADRLIEITKQLDGCQYINFIGGQKLYHKEFFKYNGVELSFIQSLPIKYNQYSNKEFVPWLSIIDVLMFNSIDETKLLLNQYRLI